MIKVTCPICQKFLKGPDQMAGRRAKCPSCQGTITVPNLQEIADPPQCSLDTRNRAVQDRNQGVFESQLTDKGLPHKLFFGMNRSVGDNSVAAYTDVDGRAFLPVWSSEDGVRDLMSYSPDSIECSCKTKGDFLLGVISHPECKLLVLNPEAKAIVGDKYSLASEPAEKLLSLHDYGAVRSILVKMVAASLEGEQRKRAVQVLGMIAKTHGEKKPLELVELVAEVINSVSEKVSSRRNCEFTEEERNVFDIMTGGNGTDSHDLTKCSVDEDVLTIEFPDGYVGKDSRLCIQIPVGTNEDYCLKEEECIRALKRCPPPPDCEKCGEFTWDFLSLSPNEKSAIWECSYCGKKSLVKDDQVYSASNTQSREPIPKEVQREVWRRDQAHCVQCGSQERLEYDHIIPVSKGGSSTVRNVQLLCEQCNRKKSDNI